MSHTEIQVSIIIVTYNSLPALNDSLISLKKSNGSDSFELIVIDNNSDDGSIETVQNCFPDAKIIKNLKNAGFAKACNQGVAIASAPILLFYNPDLEIDPDAIQLMIDFIKKTPDVGVISGRMRNRDDSFQATCRNFPNKINIILSRGSILSKVFTADKAYTLPDFSEVTQVEAVAGTFMAVLRKRFINIGYFDELFFMYMEDTDLSYRLHQAGYKNYFLPQAGGVHLWGKGSSGGRIKRNFHHHCSVWKYYSKHFSGLYTIFILPFLLLSNFLASILFPKPD